MRGKGPPRRSEFLHTRITPAYAGKRQNRHSWLRGEQDHPRLCGEKGEFHLVPDISLGSPPPMRGKGVHWRKKSHYRRITPAYAGKSQIRGGHS